jgi:hypothetical protein
MNILIQIQKINKEKNMCMELNEIKAQEEVFKSKFELFKMEMTKVKSIQKKARYFALLKNMRDMIEKEMKSYAVSLINGNVNEFFENEDLKVVKTEGNKKSYIDKVSLYNELVAKNNRTIEFLQVCNVTQSALESLEDGEDLIKKYKKDSNERNNPSITVSNLSENDRKKLNEEK